MKDEYQNLLDEQRPGRNSGKEIKVSHDGIITKEVNEWFDHMKILPILKEANSDMFPEILDFSETHYSYRYVEGYRINYPGSWSRGIRHQNDWSYFQKNLPRNKDGYGLEDPTFDINNFCSDLVELQIFKNDLVKTLYEISKKYLLFGECLIYYDLNCAQIIYNNKTKKLVMIDLDGVKKASLLEFMTHYWIN